MSKEDHYHRVAFSCAELDMVRTIMHSAVCQAKDAPEDMKTEIFDITGLAFPEFMAKIEVTLDEAADRKIPKELINLADLPTFSLN